MSLYLDAEVELDPNTPKEEDWEHGDNVTF